MALLDWINPFNKVADLVSEVVVDKDAQIRINSELKKLQESVYLAELGTQTIPWVDAIHKLSRTILSVLSMLITVYMVHNGVTDPIALGAGLAPAAGYNIVKGKGKP
jgi:uncharacterized protein YjaG (DUF416 family)